MSQMPKNSPVSMAQELLKTVGEMAPSARLEAAVKGCFMLAHPGMVFLQRTS